MYTFAIFCVLVDKSRIWVCTTRCTQAELEEKIKKLEYMNIGRKFIYEKFD